MIEVTIGGERRVGEAFDLQWLHSAIDARRRNGADSSVLVKIRSDDVDLVLRAPAMAGRGSARDLSKAEDFIVDLWSSLGLSNPDFEVEAMHSFLRKVRGFA